MVVVVVVVMVVVVVVVVVMVDFKVSRWSTRDPSAQAIIMMGFITSTKLSEPGISKLPWRESGSDANWHPCKTCFFRFPHVDLE